MKTDKEISHVLSSISTAFTTLNIADTAKLSTILSDKDMVAFYTAASIMFRLSRQCKSACTSKKVSTQHQKYNTLFNAVTL